jgi:hypothetical protein
METKINEKVETMNDPILKYLYGSAPRKKRTNRRRDSDFDGVPDYRDCQPRNPFMQDWPGDFLGHSLAATKGWDKRGRGTNYKQPGIYDFKYRNVGRGSETNTGLISQWINDKLGICINLQRDEVWRGTKQKRVKLVWAVKPVFRDGSFRNKPGMLGRDLFKYDRDFDRKEDALKYIKELKNELPIKTHIGAL